MWLHLSCKNIAIRVKWALRKINKKVSSHVDSCDVPIQRIFSLRPVPSEKIACYLYAVYELPIQKEECRQLLWKEFCSNTVFIAITVSDGLTE